MKRKISNKDKKDWKNFISNKEKLSNKYLYLSNNKIEKKIIKTIDVHGFSLKNANNVIEEFIIQCFKNHVNKIIVITGKGLRSKNKENPYVSKDLSILKNSVPEFIKSISELMIKIKNIKEAKVENGGSGAFDIFLKKNKNG